MGVLDGTPEMRGSVPASFLMRTIVKYNASDLLKEVDGKDYYTGVVGYTASTIFGEIKTEGKALIRGGKVIKWIYNGSEEEIK